MILLWEAVFLMIAMAEWQSQSTGEVADFCQGRMQPLSKGSFSLAPVSPPAQKEQGCLSCQGVRFFLLQKKMFYAWVLLNWDLEHFESLSEDISSFKKITKGSRKKVFGRKFFGCLNRWKSYIPSRQQDILDTFPFLGDMLAQQLAHFILRSDEISNKTAFLFSPHFQKVNYPLIYFSLAHCWFLTSLRAS